VSIASPSRFHHLKQQTLRLPILVLHLHLLLLDLIPITTELFTRQNLIHIHRLIFFKSNMSAAFTSYGHMLFLFCEVFFHTIDCEALRWWWGECVWVFRDGGEWGGGEVARGCKIHLCYSTALLFSHLLICILACYKITLPFPLPTSLKHKPDQILFSPLS